MTQTIDFTIIPGDIRSFEADVVVLKHAQEFLGADNAVALALGRVGVAESELQALPGSHRYVATRGAITAGHALFVGTPSIWLFDYADIREFAARALSILKTQTPDARHVAMTIHGSGIGLDEVEALFAEFTGCMEALKHGDAPRALERISIVDRDGDRIQRLRRTFDQYRSDEASLVVISPGWYRVSILAEQPEHGAPVTRGREPAMQAPGALSRATPKPHAFVAMPFKKEMDDVFYYGIQAPVRGAGFVCERVDQEAFTGDILDRVKERIESATVVIADLTGANPNVYLEVGYAWGKGRPTILLARKEEEIRFDVRGQRYLVYERIKDLEDALRNELAGLFSQGVI